MTQWQWPAACCLLLAILRLTAVAQEPAGDSEPLTPADTRPGGIRFVAYNLKNYLHMPRRVAGEFQESAPKPEMEIELLLKQIIATKPDILGICEIGSEEDLADLQARLAKAGVLLPHAGWADGADEYRNLGILSRFPIVATDHQVNLTYEINGIEFPFGRGILDATVQVHPDYQLRFLGLHLKSKRPIPEADQALMRRNEAHLVRQHIDRILVADPESNLLVYGDLNDTRNEAPVKAIQGRFGTKGYLRDVRLADEDGYKWTYWWSTADIYSRFDFVLANKAAIPEIREQDSYIFKSRDWYGASDHRPLVVIIDPEDQ